MDVTDDFGRRSFLRAVLFGGLTGSAMTSVVSRATASTRPLKAGGGSAVVNVRDYGAVGDGRTDDTAAVEAARAAVAREGGGVLEFGPAGATYAVGQVIVGSRIIYEGQGATLRGNRRVQAVLATDGEEAISDAVIRDLNIDANQLARRGILLSRASRCRVEGNRIYGFDAGSNPDGIRFHWDTDGCSASDNYVTLPTYAVGAPTIGVGIYCISNTTDKYGGGNNNTLSFASPSNLSRRHVVTGNTVLNGTHGVNLTGASSCRIFGNHLEGQTHRGIIASPIASDNAIFGNTIRDFHSAAIHLSWGSSGNVITGNVCTTDVSDQEGDGIKAYYGCDNNVVAENYIDGPVRSGVRFAVGCVGNQVTNNRINNVPVAIRLVSHLPASQGYETIQSAPDLSLMLVANNQASRCGVGALLDASGNSDVADIALNGNRFDATRDAAVVVSESDGARVRSIAATANVVSGNTAWKLPRGGQHLSQAYGNTGLSHP